MNLSNFVVMIRNIISLTDEYNYIVRVPTVQCIIYIPCIRFMFADGAFEKSAWGLTYNFLKQIVYL